MAVLFKAQIWVLWIAVNAVPNMIEDVDARVLLFVVLCRKAVASARS